MGAPQPARPQPGLHRSLVGRVIRNNPDSLVGSEGSRACPPGCSGQPTVSVDARMHAKRGRCQTRANLRTSKKGGFSHEYLLVAQASRRSIVLFRTYASLPLQPDARRIDPHRGRQRRFPRTPGMTGGEPVSAVRGDPLPPNTPTTAPSAVPEDAPSGIDAILAKPFGLDSLVRTVEQY